jgi:uncharacterized repeat protein (TIGR03806 family)
MKIILLSLLCFFLCACQKDNSESAPDPFTELSNNLGTNPILCSTQVDGINQQAIDLEKCNWLSNYGLFETLNTNNVIPRKPGIEYQLNSALFTDFAKKKRLIFLPSTQSIDYQDQETFIFPTGSVIVKMFALKQTQTDRIIEIRLLIKRESGWVFLPYIWSEEKQDGFLYANGYQLTTYVLNDNQRFDVAYNIPSQANCGECHQASDESNNIHFHPIGPKARHLNNIIEYNGQYINQLQLWQNLGMLINVPDDLSSIDTAPNWQDDSINLQDRAKAYLDINCAHCHNDNGSAALSGLRLEYWRKSISHAHGICNSSHGWRGGGFDIWPGRGEISSIPIRMRHTQAKDRMPPIGRSLVDEAAAQLISDWIDSLPFENCAP